MINQTDPQPQPEAQQDVQATLTVAVKELWGKYGIFFVIIGALLLVAKFNDLIMDFLGWKSKRDMESAMKTDDKLKAEENAANQQADALVKQAQELPKTEGTVGEDWNVKK